MKYRLIKSFLAFNVLCNSFMYAADSDQLAHQLISFENLNLINQEGLESNSLLATILLSEQGKSVLEKILDLIAVPKKLYSLAHSGFVLNNKYNTFTFSDDGRYFFDGKKLIESRTGVIHENQNETKNIDRALFTTDGKYIVLKEFRLVKVFSAPDYNLLYTITYDSPKIAVSQDNTKLIINDTIYDLATGAQLLVLPNSKLINDKEIIFCNTKPFIISSYKTKQRKTRRGQKEHPKTGIYNSSNGELITTLLGEYASITPDEKFLVTSYLHTIYIYSIENLECLHTISCNTLVDTFIFDAASTYLLAFWSINKSDGYVGYNMYTGQSIRRLKKSFSQEYAISKNAALILYSSNCYNNKESILKDINNTTLNSFSDNYHHYFYFSPTGKYAVACNYNKALLYNTVTKKISSLNHKYYSHENTLVFSPQEDLLITFDSNDAGNIIMWDLNPLKKDTVTLKEVVAFLAHEACMQNNLDASVEIKNSVNNSSNQELKYTFTKREERFKKNQEKWASRISIYKHSYEQEQYNLIYNSFCNKERSIIDFLSQKYFNQDFPSEENLPECVKTNYLKHYRNQVLKNINIWANYKSILPKQDKKVPFSDIEVISYK